MPTKRFGKVRRMLRDKKARVVQRKPFTIQLQYEQRHTLCKKTPLALLYGKQVLGSLAGEAAKHVGDIYKRYAIQGKKSMSSAMGNGQESSRRRGGSHVMTETPGTYRQAYLSRFGDGKGGACDAGSAN